MTKVALSLYLLMIIVGTLACSAQEPIYVQLADDIAVDLDNVSVNDGSETNISGLLQGDGSTISAATSINLPTGRTATYVVAASDTTATQKAQADFICDGTADNVEIQAAITALSPAGGIVQLTPGTYYIASPILLYDSTVNGGSGYPVWLKGSGWSHTNLHLVSGTNDNVIELVTGAALGFDVSKRVSDLFIYGTKGDQTAGYGIYGSNGGAGFPDFIIEHVWVDATYSHGIYLSGSWGARIINSLAESCGGDGLFLENGTQGYVENFYSQLNDGNGIRVSGQRFSIIGSQVRQAGKAGISISGTYNRIEGNSVYDWGSAEAFSAGILVGQGDNTVIGNEIIGDTTADCFYGIEIGSSKTNNIITGNRIYDCNRGDIHISSSAAGNIINDNYLDTGATYFIYNQSTLINQINGNTNYIAPNEIRSISKAITAGAQNTTTTFQNTWNNDLLITEAYVAINTAASATNPTYDMGTDNDGTGAPSVGNNIFNAIPDTVGYYRATSAGLGGGAEGVLVAPIIWQSAAGGNDWVNFIISTAAGTDTAGTIYITVMGK